MTEQSHVFNDHPEPLPELKQPRPFTQFQVVTETSYVYSAIYALDTEGKLWFRQISPPAGEGWIREEMCGKLREGAR